MGIKSSRLTAYRCGNRTPRDSRLLAQLADAVGVNLRWLMTGEGPRSGAPPEAGAYLASARVRVLEPGFRELSREEVGDADRRNLVPILCRVGAGPGAATDEAEQAPPSEAEAYVVCPDAPPRAFALRVVGDSMNPPYRPGDLVIADANRPVTRGLAAVLFEEGAVHVASLKQLYLEGAMAVLLSTNPDYEPVRLPREALAGAWEIIRHMPRVIETVRDEDAE